MLCGVAEPLLDGFYRTDVEFGSGPQHEPLVMIGVRTAQALKAEKFRGLEPGAVTAMSA